MEKVIKLSVIMGIFNNLVSFIGSCECPEDVQLSEVFVSKTESGSESFDRVQPIRAVHLHKLLSAPAGGRLCGEICLQETLLLHL